MGKSPGLRKRIALSLFTKLYAQQVARHELRTLFWECTLRCNLACRHCGSDCRVNTQQKDMPAKDFFRVLDTQITPHVDPHRVLVILSGGEVLVRADLERIGLSLRDYIDALEGAVIRTVARYGIRAGRIAGASGVWIEGAQPARKICAIGVRASRYVTMHGFALNVATDLRYFTHINPCGFTDRGATSIEKEIGRPVPMEEVKRRLVEDLCENLNVKIYK